MATGDDYDEFALLAENAAELGLAATAVPLVRRVEIAVSPGRRISAIAWGDDPQPRLVFLHGGGQNAHTWDSVLVALGRPALALDLPGHGRSGWREDRDYSPTTNASAVATVIREETVPPVVVVGMSLGGLTAISLAAQSPELVQAMLIVDVTPESPARNAQLTPAQRGTVALVSAPPTYESFEAMAEAAVQASPRRAAAAVRRGVRHNARALPDGRWTWRYDTLTRPKGGPIDFGAGWDDLSRSDAPTALVRGGESGFVHDDDIAEMERRKPDLLVQVVPGAGHSIQSDQPLALARIIAEFVDNHS
jgi:pimeloyl-ACP methyl ester carboxylesterase